MGMSTGYTVGIPEGTEEVFEEGSEGRGGRLAQPGSRKHCGSKILGDSMTQKTWTSGGERCNELRAL